MNEMKKPALKQTYYLIENVNENNKINERASTFYVNAVQLGVRYGTKKIQLELLYDIICLIKIITRQKHKYLSNCNRRV